METGISAGLNSRLQSRGPINIAVVAGEESGDYLGAGLIAAIQERVPDVRFFGIGGSRMEAAGLQTWYPMNQISLVGLDGLLSSVGSILRIRQDLKRRLTAEKPDLFIGIDVPDFNLTLERHLRRADVPVVHYVSPTVWAWRSYRVRKIRRAVDHMLTLFPFEVPFYQRHHVPVTFVGHPLADEISGTLTRADARQSLEIFPTGILIALLPGSRTSEIKRHASLFHDTAQQLAKQFSNIEFVIPFSSEETRRVFDDIVPNPGVKIHRMMGHSRTVVAASDCVLLASGTAALEAALLRRPMVVTYRVSRLTQVMVKLLGQVEHYAMPNHLTASPQVPEYMQDNAVPDKLCNAIASYLSNPDEVARLVKVFDGIHNDLRGGGHETAANVIIDLLNLNNSGEN